MAAQEGHVVRPPDWQRRHATVAVLVVVGLAAWFHLGHLLPVPGVFGAVDKRSAQTVFNEWLLLASVVTSFHLVFGVAGRFAFSTAAFMGLGAYTSHAVTRASGLHWSVGLATALAVSVALGLGFALAVRRAQHFYFAVATLGLAEVLLLVFGRWELLTGRSSGEITGTADMTVLGLALDSRSRHMWVLLVFLALVLAVTIAVTRSPLGRLAIAARDNPTVLRTTGVDVLRPGVTLFTLGCAIAAVAGSLFVHTRGLGTPHTFGIELGIGIFVALILGGLHSMWGGLVGSWFFVYVPLYLERWQEWTLVIWGAVLVVVMVAFPDGLAGLTSRFRPARPSSDAPPDPHHELVAERAPTGHTALRATGITVRFGGVLACNDIDLAVAPGEVVGLTGPNGSGKSTFLNAISGLVAADGELEVAGAPHPMGDPAVVRRAGVVRAFQTPQVWDALSCLENVALGSPDWSGLGLTSALLRRGAMRREEERRWRHSATALDRVGLGTLLDAPASTLTYGQRRMVELARTMCAEPSVLLLDEPAAGLNAAETAFLAELLGEIRDGGVSIVVVDHKIDFLDRVVDRLVVLELGRVIAEGPPEQVWDDPAVISAYLGSRRADR